MNGGRSTASGLRAWLSRRVGLLLAGILLAYLLGFFVYQASAPTADLAWQQVARYRVGDRCRLLVEYPSRVQRQPADAAGRPVTIRLWADGTPPGALSCSSTPAPAASITYSVEFGPLGAGLEFTNAAGQLVPAVLSPRLAASEGAAAPLRLYLRQAPASHSGPAELIVRVRPEAGAAPAALAMAPDGTGAPVVDLESAGRTSLRHLAKILFTAGPLQWLFTALGGVLGVLELARALQQKREERRDKAAERRAAQRDRIAALGQAEPAAAFQAYLSLRSELAGEPQSLEDLRGAFQPDWLPYLRLQLGRLLRAEQFDGAWAAVAGLQWEWCQAADAQTLLAVRALIDYLQRPAAPLTRQGLETLLEGFRAVGLGATRPVVRRLVKAAAAEPDAPATSLIEQVLFTHGGAGGRYLLSRWAEQDTSLGTYLKSWECQVLPTVSHPPRAAALWPPDRGESRALQAAVRALGLDLNPFGPVKAEQDPCLPDLFYNELPAWEEIIAPRPSVILAPPGSGRTALIWMARYESGLAGSDLEHIFPVWVPVYGISSPRDLACVLQRALASALCDALARDPYALLGLDSAERQGLADLMFRAMGGLQPVLRQLRRSGMRTDDPDGRLLHEALSTVDRRQEQEDDPLDWDVPRLCPYGTDHALLLIDVACQDAAAVDLLFEHVFDRWLAAFGPRRAVAKVLIAAQPDRCPIVPVPLAWSRDALALLLRYRLERAGLVVEPGRPALESWMEGQDLEAALLNAANGSPARLVQLGNRLIRDCAGPDTDVTS